MMDIEISRVCTAVVVIPQSQSTDTVSYTIYKASDGSVFASGNMTYLAGINWKVSFTPTSVDSYVLEVNDETLGVKHNEVYRVVAAIDTSSTPETDYSFDIATNLGKVRALIGDTTATSVQLTDGKINAFLALKSNDLFSTAALCLYAIAASKAVLAKRKAAGNYSEDLTAIAKECRETAKSYEDMAKNTPAEAVAEGFFTDFNYRELIVNKDLRDETE